MTGFRFQNIPEKNRSFGLTKDITGSQAAHPAIFFFFGFMKKKLTRAEGIGGRQWIHENVLR